MKYQIPSIAAFSLAIMFIAVASHADVFFKDTTLPDVFENQNNEFVVSAIGYGDAEFTGDPDIKLSVDRFTLYGTRVLKPGQRKFSVSGWYETSLYKFNFGDEFNAQMMGVKVTDSRMITENWAMLATAWVGSNAEDDARFEDGLRGGGGFGFQREWDSGLSFGIGAFGYTASLEKSQGMVITPNLKWRINDRSRIQLGGNAGLLFTRDLTGQNKTYLEVGVREDGRSFRLKDYSFDNIKDVAVYDSAPIAFLSLHHLFRNGIKLSLFGGFAGDRKAEYYSNDRIIQTLEFEGGPFVGFSFGWRF